MTSIERVIIDTIRSVVGEGTIGLHEPIIGDEEREAVDACLRSGYVSSVGEWVVAFEKSLVDITGAKYAVAMSSGTSALQVALIAAGVKPGDEVIVPAMSFVATASAVRHMGAIPHFVDISADTLGLDPDSLRDYLSESTEETAVGLKNSTTGNYITAIVPMHCFGHPIDMPRLLEAAEEFSLTVIEDAAEGLGSLLGDKHVGTFAQAGVLSFNGNKIVTTGGGGAVITDDEELAKKARHLSTTARVSHPWEFEHDEVGFNYRMPNINAALGVAQLSKLGEFVRAKRALADVYATAFSGIDSVSFVSEPDGATSNYWLNSLILDDSVVAERDSIIETAQAEGLQLRPAWKLLPELDPYQQHPRGPLSVARNIQPRILNIPSSAFLGPTRLG